MITVDQQYDRGILIWQCRLDLARVAEMVTDEMEEMQELNVNPLYKFCYEFFVEEGFGRVTSLL